MPHQASRAPGPGPLSLARDRRRASTAWPALGEAARRWPGSLRAVEACDLPRHVVSECCLAASTPQRRPLSLVGGAPAAPLLHPAVRLSAYPSVGPSARPPGSLAGGVAPWHQAHAPRARTHAPPARLQCYRAGRPSSPSSATPPIVCHAVADAANHRRRRRRQSPAAADAANHRAASTPPITRARGRRQGRRLGQGNSSGSQASWCSCATQCRGSQRRRPQGCAAAARPPRCA